LDPFVEKKKCRVHFDKNLLGQREGQFAGRLTVKGALGKTRIKSLGHVGRKEREKTGWNDRGSGQKKVLRPSDWEKSGKPKLGKRRNRWRTI